MEVGWERSWDEPGSKVYPIGPIREVPFAWERARACIPCEQAEATKPLQPWCSICTERNHPAKIRLTIKQQKQGIWGFRKWKTIGWDLEVVVEIPDAE